MGSGTPVQTATAPLHKPNGSVETVPEKPAEGAAAEAAKPAYVPGGYASRFGTGRTASIPAWQMAATAKTSTENLKEEEAAASSSTQTQEGEEAQQAGA
jgi:hypothetical protein